VNYTMMHGSTKIKINPLKPELNPICYLLALLAHHFLHIRRIRVKRNLRCAYRVYLFHTNLGINSSYLPGQLALVMETRCLRYEIINRVTTKVTA